MADCTWKTIYQHDSNGNPVSGSITALVRAVQRGADVQVRYYRPSGLAGVQPIEWHRTASSATIAKLQSGRFIVSCAFVDIPDSNLDSSGRTFSQPFATEWQVFNTTGMRHVVKLNHVTQAVMAQATDHLGITWYVRCYESSFLDQVVWPIDLEQPSWVRRLVRRLPGVRSFSRAPAQQPDDRG